MRSEEALQPVLGLVRSTPQPDGRIAVSSRDRGEAAALLRRAYPHVVFELGVSGVPFVFRHSVVGDARLSSTELLLSGPTRASGMFRHGVVAVGEVVAGRLTAEAERSRVDPARPFLQPSGPVRMRFDDLHLRSTALDLDAFRHAAERYEQQGGHRRLVRSEPRSASADDAWRWTAVHVQRSLRDPATLANPIVAEELFDLVVRTLLTCFGEPAEQELGPSLAASPHAVRRAVAYLEEHASNAVTVPDVAAAARVSVRSLQVLFRRHLGVSPVEHLHAIRLEAARQELQAGHDGDESTVRAVAERWGFANSGRFARLYRARFGERPSETLRGRR